MGKTGPRLNYPSIEDIIDANKKLIYQTGGNIDGAGHFHNENSLKWVLDAIQYPLFGVDHYPTISEKASLLAWTIIDGHVFIDGNKRTGLISMMGFLEQNGFYISASENQLFDIATKIATATNCGYTRKQLEIWLRLHMKLLYPPSGYN